MRLVIPLPWYSKSVYDITMDEYRGGWRRLHIMTKVKRNRDITYLGGPGFALGVSFSCCIGTKFNHMDRLDFPKLKFAPYQPLWRRALDWLRGGSR